MNVYLAPDGLWHVRIDSHELRQHYFTKDAAIAAGLTSLSRSVVEAMADRRSDAGTG